MSFGLTAVGAGALMAGGAAVYSATKGSGGSGGGSGSTTTQQQFTVDPRMQSYLYGDDGTVYGSGLLGRVATMGNEQEAGGLKGFGQDMDSYLRQTGASNQAASQHAAQGLQGSNIAAPSMYTGSRTDAAKVAAPGQNNLDLTGAYGRMINGDAGANPYLTHALQSAVDQTNASYQKNQTDLTNNLQRNILPGIGSDAVLAGQYGGTRQGIAQGNALSDYTNQLNNSNLQLGLANSANTTGQQANAFNQGQDRSLNALNTLSGQQYGVASQNAQMQQAANSQNSAQQQAAMQANLQAQMGTNQLNSTNQAAGIGLSSGLTGQMYGYSQNQDNYDRGVTGQVVNQYAPFTGLGGGSSTSTPYFTNPVGNAIGGATAGLGLYNAYNQAQNNSFNNTNNQFLNNNQGLGLSQSDLYSAA